MMMFFSHGVVIHLPATRLRRRLKRALRRIENIATEVGRSPLDPIAVISGASTEVDAPEDLPLVRLWTGGRMPGGDNPFTDPATFHVIGAAPAVDVEHLRSTIRYLADGTRIGLDGVTAAARVHRQFTLERFEDRDDLRDSMRNAFVAGGLRARIVDDLLVLSDELIANAIYDAPVQDGRHVFGSFSRRLEVPLLRPITVEVAVDEASAVVAVCDAFGSLEPERIIANLARCYSVERDEEGRDVVDRDVVDRDVIDRDIIDNKWGGAGLGLYMVLAGSSRVVFNIDPGRRTEVILVRKHARRHADFQASTPTLNICVSADTGSRDRERPVARKTVLCTVGKTQVSCLMLDLTRRGAFIHPLAPIKLTPGTAVRLTLFDDGVFGDQSPRSEEAAAWQVRPAQREITATVRWSSESTAHGFAGFGVEFDEDLANSGAVGEA